MIDWTAAWIIISGPAPTSVASVIATADTTTICQTPAPKAVTKMSPTSTPTATPMATSTPRRMRFP